MSKSLNRCTFIGYLGADPEVRYLPDGKAVCTFNLATSVEYLDKSQQQKTDTQWHRFVAYGKRGEVLGEHLMKGSRVYIEAAHRTRSYEPSTGGKGYISEFVVQDFNFLGDPKPAKDAPQGNYPAPPPAPPAPVNMDNFDDDIPY